MKIKITHYDDSGCEIYRADCLDFSGTPPVGIGRNKYEAVGSLIFVLTKDTTGGMGDKKWTEMFLKENFEIVEEQ